MKIKIGIYMEKGRGLCQLDHLLKQLNLSREDFPRKVNQGYITLENDELCISCRPLSESIRGEKVHFAIVNYADTLYCEELIQRVASSTTHPLQDEFMVSFKAFKLYDKYKDLMKKETLNNRIHLDTGKKEAILLAVKINRMLKEVFDSVLNLEQDNKELIQIKED